MKAGILRGMMAERGETQAELAAGIGISLSRFNAKLNGKADFTLGEVQAISRRYALTPDQTVAIFFDKEVSCKGESFVVSA